MYWSYDKKKDSIYPLIFVLFRYLLVSSFCVTFIVSYNVMTCDDMEVEKLVRSLTEWLTDSLIIGFEWPLCMRFAAKVFLKQLLHIHMNSKRIHNEIYNEIYLLQTWIFLNFLELWLYINSYVNVHKFSLVYTSIHISSTHAELLHSLYFYSCISEFTFHCLIP